MLISAVGGWPNKTHLCKVQLDKQRDEYRLVRKDGVENPHDELHWRYKVTGDNGNY